MKYLYKMTGQSQENGKFYEAQTIVDGMSEDELESFKKEHKFKPETIKIKKVKLKPIKK